MFKRFQEPDDPKTFTVTMGEKIRQARVEQGLSQEELAKLANIRRPSLSNMETGKMEPSAGDLFMLATMLNKPVSYFFGDKYYRIMTNSMPTDQLNLDEEELLLHFRALTSEAYKQAAIKQVRSLVELAQSETD